MRCEGQVYITCKVVVRVDDLSNFAELYPSDALSYACSVSPRDSLLFFVFVVVRTHTNAPVTPGQRKACGPDESEGRLPVHRHVAHHVL